VEDVYVYEVDLPRGINEMVSPAADNSYTIYIDRRLSDAGKMKAYRHALRHCMGDFEKSNVQEIEDDAH
jgi:hypothetical protein